MGNPELNPALKSVVEELNKLADNKLKGFDKKPIKARKHKGPGRPQDRIAYTSEGEQILENEGDLRKGDTNPYDGE